MVISTRNRFCVSDASEVNGNDGLLYYYPHKINNRNANVSQFCATIDQPVTFSFETIVGKVNPGPPNAGGRGAPP
jgi:hypothetical protein